MNRTFYLFWYRSTCTRKNRFAEVSKSLALDTDLKIILLDHQNNYVERLSVDDNSAKSWHSNNQLERPT